VSAGDLWYNSTSGALKAAVFLSDAWAAGGNLNTGRGHGGGFGTQTAAVAVAGVPAPTTGSENYRRFNYRIMERNSSWTFGGASPSTVATARWFYLDGWRKFNSGAGTQTSGLAFGGYNGTTGFISNRRIYRCFSNSKNSNHKLT
jgi:hypothetical protein